MGVWFARRASQNVDANDGSTWNDKADGSGNWLTWANLAAGDVLCANGNVGLSCNVDFTCARCSVLAEVGSSDTGAAGGGFTVSSARTLSFNAQAGTVACLVSSGSSNWTLIGTPIGGTSSAAHGITHGGTGILTVTGTPTPGTGANARGISNNSTGIVNVTSAANVVGVSGGSGGNAAVFNNTTGQVNITAPKCQGGAAGSYVLDNNTGTCSITSDVEGGSDANTPALYSRGAGITTIIGKLLMTVGRCHPIGGFMSVYYTPAAADYIRVPLGSGTTQDYPKQLAAGNIKAGVVSGTVTGTHGSAPLVGLGGLVG